MTEGLKQGKFEYASAVDIATSQEKLDNQIRASEENYLQGVKENDDEKLDLLEKRNEQLTAFSKSAANAVKKIRDDRRAEFIKDINYRVLTEGVSEELQATFRGEREQLFVNGTNINFATNEFIKETGDTITAREFQKMNKWEQYQLVEAYVKKEAKGYADYYYRAYNEVTLPDGRGFKDNLSPAEEAYLDTKIKREFGYKFAGVNEALIAEYAKPEIDTFDETRRKQRVALKEKMWWAKRGEKDRDLLKTNLLVAGPAAKIDGYNKWITTYMSNYDVDAATARDAFVANLISLVEDDESGVSSQDALRLINTTFQGRDGVERTLLSWKEFDGIESKLIDAHKKSKDSETAKYDQTISFWVDSITSDRDNIDEIAEIEIRKIFKQKYGYVPAEIEDSLRGHLPNDDARRFLDNQLKVQDGVLFDHQLLNVSNTVRSEYEDKLATAYNANAGFDERVTKIISGATNQAMNSNLGELDSKSIAWLTMQSNITKLYRDTYRDYIDSSGQPSDARVIQEAHRLAQSKVEMMIKDTDWVNAAMTTDYESYEKEHGEDAYEKMIEGNEIYGTNVRSGMEQAESGKWKGEVVKIDKDYMKALMEWGQNPKRSWKDLPPIYKDIARRNNIADPMEFAETQYKLMMDSDANFGFPKTVKYESKTESPLEKEIRNNPNTMNFLNGFSNNGKVLQAYISHNNLDNEDVALSIYNDKSFVSPELA